MASCSTLVLDDAVVSQLERHVTVGVVNCCKWSETLGTCCSQSSSVVLMMPKSNRRRASFFSECNVVVYLFIIINYFLVNLTSAFCVLLLWLILPLCVLVWLFYLLFLFSISLFIDVNVILIVMVIYVLCCDVYCSAANETAAEAIMTSVRDTIAAYPFLLQHPEEQIRILSGTEEGVFGWITTNYLSGNFGVCIFVKLWHCEMEKADDVREWWWWWWLMMMTLLVLSARIVADQCWQCCHGDSCICFCLTSVRYLFNALSRCYDVCRHCNVLGQQKLWNFQHRLSIVLAWCC